jgi:hypothetical protein
MSLFNETVARANRAEKALDDAQARILSLESALKACLNDKRKLIEAQSEERKQAQAARKEARASELPESPGIRVSGNHNELNNLSGGDVEEMFRQYENGPYDARMAEQVYAAGLKPAADNSGMSVPIDTEGNHG